MQHPLLYQGCMRFVLSVSAEIVVHGAVRQSRRCCQSCTSYCAALVTSEAQTFTDWTERDVAAVWISSPLLLPVLTRRSEWMVTPVFQENAGGKANNAAGACGPNSVCLRVCSGSESCDRHRRCWAGHELTTENHSPNDRMFWGRTEGMDIWGSSSWPGKPDSHLWDSVYFVPRRL